jgi:hypothetical protein
LDKVKSWKRRGLLPMRNPPDSDERGRDGVSPYDTEAEVGALVVPGVKEWRAAEGLA